MLSHSIRNEIRPAVHKNAAANRIGPVVVMRKPSEARLDPSDDDGRVFIFSSDEIAVHDHCSVGTQSGLSSGGIGIFMSALFRDGVMIDHRIHVSRRNKKAEPRFPEFGDAVIILMVRLRKHADPVTEPLQDSAYHSRPERRMVDIRVSRDIDKIGPVPSSVYHFLPVCGEKFIILFHYFKAWMR